MIEILLNNTMCNPGSRKRVSDFLFVYTYADFYFLQKPGFLSI